MKIRQLVRRAPPGTSAQMQRLGRNSVPSGFTPPATWMRAKNALRGSVAGQAPQSRRLPALNVPSGTFATLPTPLRHAQLVRHALFWRHALVWVLPCHLAFFCLCCCSHPLPGLLLWATAGSYGIKLGGVSQADACTACDAGFYCLEGGTERTRVLCPPGSYCPPSSDTFTECDAGSYNPTTGAISDAACLPCPAGVWCPQGAADVSRQCAWRVVFVFFTPPSLSDLHSHHLLLRFAPSLSSHCRPVWVLLPARVRRPYALRGWHVWRFAYGPHDPIPVLQLHPRRVLPR